MSKKYTIEFSQEEAAVVMTALGYMRSADGLLARTLGDTSSTSREVVGVIIGADLVAGEALAKMLRSCPDIAERFPFPEMAAPDPEAAVRQGSSWTRPV